jgi:hypothetical protein
LAENICGRRLSSQELTIAIQLRHAFQHQKRMQSSMKIRAQFCLLAFVSAVCLSAEALDTPIQETARQALMEKLRELDNPPPPRITNRTVPPPAVSSAPIVVSASVKPAVAVAASAAPAISPPPVKPVVAVVSRQPARQPVKSAPVTRPPLIQKPADNLVDVYGRIYRHAEVIKAGKDGILVSYWNAVGGFEMSWIEFKDLPLSLCQRYEIFNPSSD